MACGKNSGGMAAALHRSPVRSVGWLEENPDVPSPALFTTMTWNSYSLPCACPTSLGLRWQSAAATPLWLVRLWRGWSCARHPQERPQCRRTPMKDRQCGLPWNMKRTPGARRSVFRGGIPSGYTRLLSPGLLFPSRPRLLLPNLIRDRRDAPLLAPSYHCTAHRDDNQRHSPKQNCFHHFPSHTLYLHESDV